MAIRDPNDNPIQYDTSPVSGFSDPDTAMAFHLDDFWTLLKKLKQHRQANKLEAGIPRVFALVLCYLRNKRGLTCDMALSEKAVADTIGTKKGCSGCMMSRLRSWRNGRLGR